MGSKQTIDPATKIIVTAKGASTNPFAGRLLKGEYSKRYHIYQLIVSSRSVGDAYDRKRAKGYYASDWDFKEAIGNGCIVLDPPHLH